MALSLPPTLRTGTFTPANDSLLVVVAMFMRNSLAAWDVAGQATISGGGLTWTRRIVAESTNDYNNAFVIWTAPVTTGASMSITVTSPTNTLATWNRCYEYTGHDVASPMGLVTSGSTASTDGSYNPSLGASPASTSDVLAAISTTIAGAGNVDIDNGTGWTELGQENSASFYGSQIQRRSGSTDSTVLWNDLDAASSTDNSFDGYRWVAIEIKEASSAVPNTAFQQNAFQSTAFQIYGGTVAGGSSGPAGIAQENDAAFALSAARPAGLAAENDTAIARGSARPVGLAAESDAALALGAARPAGLSSENDLAIALGSARPAGLAAESDSALALAGSVGSAVGRADESDQAFALAGVSSRAVGLAAESDQALALAGVASRPAGRADENDAALALASVSSRAVGRADEQDVAFALSAGGAAPAGLAAETDTAFALGSARPAGVAQEQDAAFALAGEQIIIQIPQTSFSEFSGAVRKESKPRQARVRAPKTQPRRRESPKPVEAVSAPVGVAVERDEAMALVAQVLYRHNGLLRTRPHIELERTTPVTCSQCGAPMAAHRST